MLEIQTNENIGTLPDQIDFSMNSSRTLELAHNTSSTDNFFSLAMSTDSKENMPLHKEDRKYRYLNVPKSSR
jgi:hypothetical protein